jgi:hypothetical protein
MKIKITNKKTQVLILLSFALFVIFYHTFGYLGHFGYDDMHYARIANDFNKGIIDYNDHFTFRTPVIILTSLSYAIFGISDFASSLPAILISISVLYILFLILRNYGNKVLVIGLAFTTLSNWYIYYSDKLMPDIYVTLAVAGALYCIYNFRYNSTKNKILLYSISLDLILLFGFMAKETIVLILPLLLYLFIADIIRNKNVRFWIYTLIGGVILFLVYFSIIGLITGDFFKRFEAISANSYLNLCSYDQQSFGIVLKRIVYQFFTMLIYQGMAPVFIVLGAFLIKKGNIRMLRQEDAFSFWVISVVFLLFSANFMSISVNSYSPMCLDPRHYLFLLPVASIPASIIMLKYIEKKEYSILLVIVSAMITIISFFLQGESFSQLYLPLFLLFLFNYIFGERIKNKIVFVMAFVAILAIMPFSMIKYAKSVNYDRQKEILQEQILKTEESVLVITDVVQKNIANYLNNFSDDKKIEFICFDELEKYKADKRKKILYKNSYTQYLSGISDDDLPIYAKNLVDQNNLLFQDKDLKISICEFEDISGPQKTGKVLIQSKNDFESRIEKWSYVKAEISDEIKYKGKFSNLIGEYSSTFVIDIDSVNINDVVQILINCSAYCNFPDKTTASMVISLENDKEAYFWKGMEINKYIKAYSNWWQVKQEISIKKTDILPGSRIKVYVWNKDKQKAYIDDFEISILGYK